MAKFFVRLYPDELLMSAFARYALLMNYASPRSWSEDLFGATYPVNYELPGYLDVLRQRLNCDNEKKEEWLYQHTLYSFYSPFLKPTLKNQLIQFMNNPSEINLSKIWNIGSQFEYLRYCAECVREDRTRYGEAYWHRVHQVCLYCPHHLQPIQTSRIKKWSGKSQSMIPVTAETALAHNIPFGESLFASHQGDPILDRLNDDILWILAHSWRDLNRDSVRTRLRTLLLANGFLTPGGKLRTTGFIKELNNFFSESLLNQLGLLFSKGHPHAWATMAAADDKKETNHPFQYLLLIQFFGHTMATFRDVDTNYAYFGNGPWKCKNPVCSEYNLDSIKEVEVRNMMGKVIGIFQCSCGYTYQETWSRTYSHKSHKVLAYGPLWEERLRELWQESNPNVSLSRISAVLNLAPLTVKRNAVRLGLQDANLSSAIRPLLRGEQYKRQPVSEEDISERREEWLNALTNFPESGTDALIKSGYGSTYYFLLHYDYDWIQSHQPSTKYNKLTLTPSLREAHRRSNDIHIAEKLVRIADQVKNSALYPKRRLSVTWLCESFPATHRVLGKNAANSPLSTQVISALTESDEQFLIRQLAWLVCEHQLTTIPDGLERFTFDSTYDAGEAKFQILEKLIHLAQPTVSVGEVILQYLWYPEGINWATLDFDLAAQITAIRTKIVNENGYPIKVTKTSIGYELQALPALLNTPHKLPQTTERIRKSIEGDADYGLRLVNWGYMYFVGKRRKPSRDDFIRTARLNNLVDYAQIPEVADAINAAISKLARSKSSSSGLRHIQQLHQEATFIERDNQLAQEVLVVADNIRNMKPPVRVTTKTVQYELDGLFRESWNRAAFVKENLEKLPNTVRALDLVSESPSEFRLRRYCHKVAHFRGAIKNPTLPSLLDEYKFDTSENGLVSNSQTEATLRVNQLDRYLRETIILAAIEILELSPTQRVTSRAILKLTGLGALEALKAHSTRDTAPITFEALALLAESPKRFHERRLIQIERRSGQESDEPILSAIIVKRYLSQTFTQKWLYDQLTGSKTE